MSPLRVRVLVLGSKFCVFRLRLLPAALALAAVVAPCFVAAPGKTPCKMRGFGLGVGSGELVTFCLRTDIMLQENGFVEGCFTVLVTSRLSLIRSTRAVSFETSEACHCFFNRRVQQMFPDLACTYITLVTNFLLVYDIVTSRILK